ncbi:ATPase [Candidatus Gracilibacteria bacterium]|nr:ATPase [Candidatus Gracilibacteria bacterium]
MAQIAIREYDAKRMFAEYSPSSYTGYLIESEEDIVSFSQNTIDTTWVIKPDQLFGKRGKYGLLGVNLNNANICKWWKDHFQKETTIGKQVGKLTTFLIEPFVPHTEEYYVAIKTERDHDVIYFSRAGGIEVEENWDQVQSLNISLFDSVIARHEAIQNFSEKGNGLLHTSQGQIRENLQKLDIADSRVLDFISQLYSFFQEYGFAYLEVNPFTFDSIGNVVCLDMVARVDDSEEFRQRKHWENLVFPHPFGPEKTKREQYIEKLDAETGASLKFRILNPMGRIWLLTSGGGASVIIADTLADLGFATEIGNYGECSGNPDRENTRAYTATLLDTMLENDIVGKYLVIAGAIANFTHIDKTFAGIIDAFRDRIEDMKKQDIRILVRRGGINDTRGLELMKNACEELGLPCEIADGSVYMTDILKKIIL